ncbi:protein DA1-like isoform X2 [Punica granatum]|uniref:Protein DA1-like isoform X2 n=2 Tax=Punica granatum TaxID=22663 RepID=A0A6P8ELB7_PUNGR|nr:protein DA1-like isoform X2 [Punica granatum]
MGWFSKIFGNSDSDHTVSEGHFHGSGSYGTISNYTDPSTSGDALSDYENEDIDRAIALSLLEQSQNRGNAVDDESQLEEEEQLARAIQESLKIKSSPPGKNRPSHSPPQYRDGYSPQGYNNGYSATEYGNETAYQPVPIYYPYPAGYRICAGCNTVIDHGRFLSSMNSVWHPECFRCHACNLAISEYEFSTYDNYPFHKYCYKEHYHPKCDICKHFIPTNSNGQIEYRAHPFWAQKYCPCHEDDGTPRCCSCERMEPRDTRYVALNDGRELCLECLDSAIRDTNECQPLYRDIKRFYEGLDMKVEQDVPLLLVERQALNEAREGEKNGHYHMPETRGLCLSEEQTISTISRQPRIWGDQTADVVTEPYRLTRHCEVTAILILHGLPRLLTGTILAHEMMHAWLRLKGYPTLRQDVEEGICQVLAHMWLDYELNESRTRASKKGKTQRSQFDQKLGNFFKHQVESDTSPVYGDGFRAGWQAVQKYGLNRTLDHISVTGNFPY